MTALRRRDEVELDHGEVAICHSCEAVAVADDGLVVDERCTQCGSDGVIVRDLGATGNKSISSRWSADVAACGFVATPNVFQDHFTDLGLSVLDYVLLDLIEQHRRDEDLRSWPSQETLARKAGKSESQVERRLKAMRARGLIDWTKERRRGGQFEFNVYTRAGLSEVCALIAANRRARLEDEMTGVDALLVKLAQRAAHHPAWVQATTPHPCGKKKRQLKKTKRPNQIPLGRVDQ